jgi:molecular chaperone HscB
MAECPHCRAPLETPLACGSCGRLLATGSDPTPFETLGLEASGAVDPAELRRRLLRFSRLTHPDYFAAAAPEERARAEHATALLNAAHEILSDDVRRATWLVRHLGGPDENEERAMPAPFLAEVLEWNEMLAEARATPGAVGDPQLLGLKNDLLEQRREALASIARRLSPLPTRGAPALREVRRELNAVRYLDRALSEIEALRLSRAESRG